MNQTTSINFAISKLLVGVVLVITLLYSMLLIAYSWVIEDNIFNRQVQIEASYIEQTFTRTGQVVEPRSSYMTLHKNWQGLPAQFAIEYQHKPDKVEFKHPNGQTLHLKIIYLNDVPFALAADVASFEVSRDFLPPMLWLLAALSLACCLTVAIVAITKAKKITKPLNRLAEQVSKPDNLANFDIGDDFPDNEIGILATQLKNAFRRLKEAWQREAHFTKDISHEIRTPLAMARNILAKSHNQIYEQDWQTLRDANISLFQTSETLLALARNESTQAKSTNLNALLEHCLLRHYDVNFTEQGQAIEFVIDAEQDVYQTVNPNLIEILFNNVLANIVHYTASMQVTIRLEPTGFTFTNDYQHTPPSDPLTSGAKSATSQGLGHGLNIIKRIADVYGWRTSVEVNEQRFSLLIIF